MNDLFDAFTNCPDARTFLRAREAVARSPAYNPAAGDLEAAIELHAREHYNALGRFLVGLKPVSDGSNYRLSPTYYRLLGRFAELAGHETAARVLDCAVLCVRGILSTGDGTPRRPFLVLHFADVLEVLCYLGKRAVRMSLVPGDVWGLHRADGTDVWFDGRVIQAALEARWPGHVGSTGRRGSESHDTGRYQEPS